MGKVVGPPIPENAAKWLKKQKVFFVASAATSTSNHVNVSPKSSNEFRILDEKRVCYLDFCGSGSETSAHIFENGRCTFMFVALNGAPKIMRFYGTGRVIPRTSFLTSTGELVKHGEIKQLCSVFNIESPQDERFQRSRCVIILDIDRISDSCGYSIPKYEYTKDRNTLNEALDKYEIENYIAKKNSFSIDGLKGIGQVVRSCIPTKRVPVKGYFFAEYNNGEIQYLKDEEDHKHVLEQKNASGWRTQLKKMIVQLQMIYARGINRSQRDILLFILGLCSSKLLSNVSSRSFRIVSK